MGDSEFVQLSKVGDQRNPIQETRYQELLRAQGGGGGFNDFGVGGVLAGQRAAGDALLNRQSAEQNAFTDRFRSALFGQEALPAMASRIGNELGLPDLQKGATYLNTQVANMPFTQRDLTRGFDVNQNQLNNLTNQKIYELTPALTTTNNALAAARASRDEQMGFNVAQQQKELLPFNMERDFLADRMARETTLFSNENQNELTSILQKMNLGVQISEAEKNRAHELAMKERDYEFRRQELSSQTPDRYLSGGQFYDTSTGQWITAPKTSGGGSSYGDINQYRPPATPSLLSVPYGIPGAAGYSTPSIQQRPSLGDLFNL